MSKFKHALAQCCPLLLSFVPYAPLSFPTTFYPQVRRSGGAPGCLLAP